MAFTYAQVIRQVDNLLGQIVGNDIATAETNYTATASTSNRRGPDFPPTAVQDAVINTITEIVGVIAGTMRHPERVDFTEATSALTSGATVPTTSSGGTKLIGRHGEVRDGSNSKSLKMMPLDRLQNFRLLSSTVFGDADIYGYAFDEGAGTILHTRSTVTISWPAFARPSSASGNIPLRDDHERAVVCGAIKILAPKEAQYSDLLASCAKYYDEHLAGIIAVGNAPV